YRSLSSYRVACPRADDLDVSIVQQWDWGVKVGQVEMSVFVPFGRSPQGGVKHYGNNPRLRRVHGRGPADGTVLHRLGGAVSGGGPVRAARRRGAATQTPGRGSAPRGDPASATAEGPHSNGGGD